MALFRCSFKLFKYAVIITIFIALFNTWINNKSFTFNNDALTSLVKKNTDKKVKTSFENIHRELSKEFPGKILPKSDLEWVLIKIGGLSQSVCVLHASLTEYVIFSGSPLSGTGHFGGMWINVTSNIVTGQAKIWKKSNFETTSFNKGAVVHTVAGESEVVYMKENTWFVQYGRGFVHSGFVCSLLETLFYGNDFLAAFHYYQVVIKSLFLVYFGIGL